MKHDLGAALARIGAWLEEHHAAYAQVLGPPCESEALATYPTDVRTLLRWHNGQSDGGSSSFFGMVWLIPDDQIEAQRRENAQTAKDIKNPAWWSDAWYPFADDGEGNLYCVHAETGEVIFYQHDHGTRPVIAPSLGAFFAAIAKGLESDVIALDDDTLAPTDDEEWTKLYERYGLTDPIAYAP